MDVVIPNIAAEAEQLGAQEMAEAVLLEHQGDLQYLKQAAIDYKQVVDELDDKLRLFTHTLKRQSQIRKQVGKTNVQMVDEYIKNKAKVQEFLISDIPKKLYHASFEFQNKLNEFLGQQVKMIFVVEGADGPELYEMTSEEILRFDYSSSNKLSARYKVTNEDLGKSLKKLEITESNLNFSLTGLKTTYSEVLQRYRISRSQNLRFLMWKPGNSWKKMVISAEGDINEAYAAFVFLNKASPSFKRSMEYNVGDFAQGIAAVDNMSGLLKGDVSVGNIEYGIKSAGASALGLKQMEMLATQILQEDFSQESLQKIQQKMINRARTRNHIEDLIDNKTNSLLKSLSTQIK